mgnify:CR=1 FL=1
MLFCIIITIIIIIIIIIIIFGAADNMRALIENSVKT